MASARLGGLRLGEFSCVFKIAICSGLNDPANGWHGTKTVLARPRYLHGGQAKRKRAWRHAGMRTGRDSMPRTKLE